MPARRNQLVASLEVQVSGKSSFVCVQNLLLKRLPFLTSRSTTSMARFTANLVQSKTYKFEIIVNNGYF